MSFVLYEKIKEQGRLEKLSPSAMARKMGFSDAALSLWKHGRMNANQYSWEVFNDYVDQYCAKNGQPKPTVLGLHDIDGEIKTYGQTASPADLETLAKMGIKIPTSDVAASDDEEAEAEQPADSDEEPIEDRKAGKKTRPVDDLGNPLRGKRVLTLGGAVYNDTKKNRLNDYEVALVIHGIMAVDARVAALQLKLSMLRRLFPRQFNGEDRR